MVNSDTVTLNTLHCGTLLDALQTALWSGSPSFFWTPEQDLDEWMTSVVLVCTCLCLLLSYTKSIIIALVANPLSLMD